MKKIFEEFIKPIVKQPWYIILGSIVGGFGMINLLDSVMVSILKHPWSLIPLWFMDLLLLFRAIFHPIYDFLFGWLHIKIPVVIKDYLTMGIIVMFMRMRSTSVIAKEIKMGTKASYKQKVLNGEIKVTQHSTRFTWFLFYLSRLSYALFLWPEKLFGAMLRFATGKKKPGTSQSQYVVFFSSVFWFLIILMFLAVLKAAKS